MDWITEAIAIGNYRDAQDVALLQREGIAAVVSLDRTLQQQEATVLGLREVESVPLEDGPGNDPRLFRRAVDALERLVRRCPPVLVQCHAGRSRSAVVVAGYLVRSLGLSAEEALARIAERRPIAVAAGLERLLESLE